MGALSACDKWNALDAGQAGFKEFIGLVLNPAGGNRVRRAAVGGVIFEAAILGRVVRGGDDNAVGKAAFPAAVVGEDRMGNDRSGRVIIAVGNPDLDVISGKDLEGSGAGGDREGVGVNAEEERAVGSLAFAIEADGLRDGHDMSFIEIAVEGGAAMAGGAKGDALRGHRGIGRRGKIGREEPGYVDKRCGVHRFAGKRACFR